MNRRGVVVIGGLMLGGLVLAWTSKPKTVRDLLDKNGIHPVQVSNPADVDPSLRAEMGGVYQITAAERGKLLRLLNESGYTQIIQTSSYKTEATWYNLAPKFPLRLGYQHVFITRSDKIQVQFQPDLK